eukprot:COSAG02_NODE_57393_length_280_cov_59.193370_1_plen_88_part_01
MVTIVATRFHTAIGTRTRVFTRGSVKARIVSTSVANAPANTTELHAIKSYHVAKVRFKTCNLLRVPWLPRRAVPYIAFVALIADLLSR